MLLVDEIFRKAHPEIIPRAEIIVGLLLKKELREDVPLKILFIDTNSLDSIFSRFSIFFISISNIFLVFFISVLLYFKSLINILFANELDSINY